MTLYFLYYFLIHLIYHFLMDNTQTEQKTIQQRQQTQDEVDLALDLEFYSLDTKKGYIRNDTLFINSQIPKSILSPVYYTEIFMTEYDTFYIILDYEITHSILESFKIFYQNNNVSPLDIVELISYNLFGYYNLTDTLFNSHAQYVQQHKTLLKQYIIDRKCKFAVKTNYYNGAIRILDNQNIYDIGTLEEIHKHYNNEAIQRISHGMFYWITFDNLDIDADDTEDAVDTLIN